MAERHQRHFPDDHVFVSLQWLRALTAIGIMSNHWADHYYAGLIPQQQITIDIFFMVEGFLAAHLLGRLRPGDGAAAPVLRRLIKIYPLYLIALAAGVALMFEPAFLRLDGWFPRALASAALLGIGLQPTLSSFADGAVFPLNPPSWAIVLELWGFIAMCLLRDRLRLSALALIYGVGLVVAVGLALMWRDVAPGWNLGWQTTGYAGGLPRMIMGFFGGALIYSVMRVHGPIVPRIHPLLIVAALIGMLFLKLPMIGLLLWTIGVPLLVWSAAASANPAWAKPIAHAADRHAYGIYLLHFPVLVAYRALGDHFELSRRIMASPGSYLLALGLVLLVAHLVVRFIDEPVRRWITDRIGDRGRPVSVSR